MPLSFDQLVSLLQQPPDELCESELQHLTPAEYDRAFTTVVRLYYRKVRGFIARITEDRTGAEDITQ